MTENFKIHFVVHYPVRQLATCSGERIDATSKQTPQRHILLYVYATGRQRSTAANQYSKLQEEAAFYCKNQQFLTWLGYGRCKGTFWQEDTFLDQFVPIGSD